MLISQYIKSLYRKYYNIDHRSKQATETKTIVGVGDVLNIKDGAVEKQLSKKILKREAKILHNLRMTIKHRKKKNG